MTGQQVSVHSEIGRLRRVLVHEPGLEVDHMVPATMDELLFDDMLFGDRSREEHALFRRVLQFFKIEPVEALDLLTQVLGQEEAREWVMRIVAGEFSEALRERMMAAEPGELALMLTTGVRGEVRGAGVEVEELFSVSPLPNWCFQRDPQVVLGDSVIFGAMASPARHREAMLSRAIFQFHPDLSAVPVIHDPLEKSTDHGLFVQQWRPRLEGGDLLVFSDDVIAVGSSERTNESAITTLARNLAHRDGGPRWLLTVELPRRRAYMHLDTVITPVDRDAALVYPPVILSDGPEGARVHEIDLHSRELRPVEKKSLLSGLKARGVDLEPISCGGSDPLHQQREQWTDGANALAVAPGVIVLYERNVETRAELSRHGFEIVFAKDLMLGKTEADLETAKRVCVVIPSHEMARARGGPHCLTHPLLRDPV